MLLEGVRVLECASGHQGPVACAMLGDLGADVIKVENPVSGDRIRSMLTIRGVSTVLPGNRNFVFEYANRNKRGITLNLKKEKGREVLYRLVKKSDVFVNNFIKPDMEKLGLSYETLSQYNPQLIYAHGSSFGTEGPESEQPGVDSTAVAYSGLMNAVGEPDMPPQMFVEAPADEAGSMVLAYGIMAALVGRERLGIGQKVEASLLSGLITLQMLNLSAVLSLGQERPKQYRAKAPNPLVNHYQCSDGKWIRLAHMMVGRDLPEVFRVLGLEELVKDPRFENTQAIEKNCEELISILDKHFATKTSAEWTAILKQSGSVIYAPVNSVSDLPTDPQVLANEYIVDFNHRVLGPVKMVGFPANFSKTPGSIRREAPEFGQHTEEVLLEVGEYTWDEIAELKEQGVL
ncbi:CaiB/BaiF CoA transferase family protein [Chloroflexota bacterium]